MQFPQRLHCADASKLIVEYHEGELDPGAARLVAEHLYQCPSCRRRDLELTQIDQLVADFAPRDISRGFVYSTVNAMAPATRWRVQLLTWTGQMRSWSLATAAAAILVTGFVVFVRPPRAAAIVDPPTMYQSIASDGNILGAGRLIGTAGVAGIELPIAPTDHVAQTARIVASAGR
ncbi:MAG: zf-HC2 domain-containing protein [Planctomycetes bacterium]|nr:zf-HC2 domain-containing protein [Planctomycetota bacterium]